MWDQAPEFVALLERGLAAVAHGDLSEAQTMARRLDQLARTSLATAPWWLLQERAEDIARLAGALADAGDRDLGRTLLVATANFFTHTGAICVATVRRVLLDSPDDVFDFVKAAYSGGIDFDAFGMDTATLVRTVRDRLCAPAASEPDVFSGLYSLPPAVAATVIALGLRRFGTSGRLWEEAAARFLADGDPANAALAYERSVLADRGGPTDESPDLEELLTRLEATGHPVDGVRPSDPERAQQGRSRDRVPGRDLPALVNLALLVRRLHGPSIARDVVARHAPLVAPRVAAMAYLDAGAGEDAVHVLTRALQAGPDVPDAQRLAVELARVYFALGRTVDAVATMRVLLDLRGDLPRLLDVLFGSCKTPHRLRHVGAWRGLFPPDTVEDIRAAATDALVRECTPAPAEREEAIGCLATLAGGSREERASALAALRRLGAVVSPVLHAHLAGVSERERVQLAWLLEQWAWEAADRRFQTTSGFNQLPSASFERRQVQAEERHPARPVERRYRIGMDVGKAIAHLRVLEVEEACCLVDGICDESEGCHADDAGLDLVAALADLLIAEGEVARARRLLCVTMRSNLHLDALARFRALLAADASTGFDLVVADRTDWRAFQAFSLHDGDLVRLATERLASERLSLEATVWMLEHLKEEDRNELLQPALRCFPEHPILLLFHGCSAVLRGAPDEALCAFDEAVRLRRVGRGPDPDGRPGVHHEGLLLLAGYPPPIARPDGVSSRSLADVRVWNPLLVNLAIVRCALEGRERALADIERRAHGETAFSTAASLSAIGEADAAYRHLEREVSRRGSQIDDLTLGGLIAAYAATDRLEEAIAVAGLVLGDHYRAKEHIELLITTIIDQWSDDLPDEVLEYERRFDIRKAVDGAIEALVQTHVLPPERHREVRELAEDAGADDFAVRSRVFAGLRAVGPSAGAAVADAMRTVGERGRRELHDLLETWAWQEAQERTRARLAFPSSAARPGDPG